MSKSLMKILPILCLALLMSSTASATVLETAVAKGKPARDVNCDPNAEGCIRDLVAGQHTVVGSVSVVATDDALLVTYDTTASDWWITEIHFEVSDDPITKAAPGQFGTNPYIDAPTQYFQFIVEPPMYRDTCGNDGEGYHYAAHAVVQEATGTTGIDLSLPGLPETIDFTLSGGGNSSYISNTVLDSAVFNGSPYAGWCIDEDRLIFLNREYTAQVFSSYEALPEGAVDKPDMLDEVNWLINQPGLVGSSVMGCDDPVAPYDVQLAIWSLVEDELQPDKTLTCQAEKVAEAAETYGAGFEPSCGDQVAVVLVPFDPNGEINAQVTIISAQVTVIATEADCQPIFEEGFDETAWACGDFIRPGKNWAMTFQCCAE